MQIANHKLVGVPFVASPNISGMLNPSYVVMHYTAGWNDESAIANFKNPASKVSAHVVVERDGTITQCVPFNRVAWHAGPSKYDGKNGMNNYSVGIEIVNIGFLKETAKGVFSMWTGSKWVAVPADRLKDYDLTFRAPNARIGGDTYVWPAYTKKQMAVVKELFALLCATYKIVDVTGHENIDTRGWKTDPGPAFPMGEFKAMLHAGTPRNDNHEAHGTFVVKADALNVRREPSANAGVLVVLRKGEEVAVVKDLGVWSYVEYDPGKFGYVSDQYLAAA